MMVLAVLSLLIALGDDFFLYRVLYELLPGFDKFRVPSMILAVHHLAVIVLAAHGLEALVSSAAARTRPRWLGRPTLVVSLSVALVLLLLGSIGADALRDSMATNWGDMAQQFGRPVPPADAVRAAADLAVADALRVGAILAAIPLVLVAVAMRRLPVPWAMGLIAFLLFLDLWRVQMPLIHPEGTSAARPTGRQPGGGGRLAADDPRSREIARLHGRRGADALAAGTGSASTRVPDRRMGERQPSGCPGDRQSGRLPRREARRLRAAARADVRRTSARPAAGESVLGRLGRGGAALRAADRGAAAAARSGPRRTAGPGHRGGHRLRESKRPAAGVARR